MTDNELIAKAKRDKLKAKRDGLYKEFLKHPADIHLAIEIKSIDDQVAESVQQRKPGSGSKS
ncbi:MAG: hypothetical protein WBL63_00950 [Candidatus Acidiferrum sp.]